MASTTTTITSDDSKSGAGVSAFVELLGDTLVSKGGNVTTAEALAGKTVGLYFSAHWCPPCRKFTPEFASVYSKSLKAKNLEVVFVSSDKDQASFDSYFGEMPWLALPYALRDEKNAISQKFKVSGIPTLVILNSDGEVITDKGRGKVSADPTGTAFPWHPKTLSELIGTSFIGSGGTPVERKTLEGKTIGLYFSAHWCPPCKRFTPKFAATYKKLKAKDTKFEVIFVSSDQDQQQFDDYFEEMPWLAIPFSERMTKNDLSEHFSVRGIPSLVILDSDFNVIRKSAVGAVGSDPEGADFPWPPKPVNDIDVEIGDINSTAAIISFTHLLEESKAGEVVGELTAVAEEVISAAKEAKKDPKFLFYTQSQAEGGASGNISRLCPKASGEKVTGLLLNIPGENYSYIKEPITQDSLRTLMAAFEGKTLELTKLQG